MAAVSLAIRASEPPPGPDRVKKHNEYHHLVYEIDHMSDMHLDRGVYKQSMDIDKYLIKKWYDSSIGRFDGDPTIG